MEIKKIMKGCLCYKNRDNAEVKLWNAVVVVPVSTWTNPPCIHKYSDFCCWWKTVVWYLTDQMKSEQVLKKLVTLALCYVKSWMAVDEPRTEEVD